MDYGKIDVLSTSQGRPTADASLGVTYRTRWGRPEDVRTFFGYILRTSSGRNFSELVDTRLKKVIHVPVLFEEYLLYISKMLIWKYILKYILLALPSFSLGKVAKYF